MLSVYINECLTVLELADLTTATLCVTKHEIIWNMEAFKLCLDGYIIK